MGDLLAEFQRGAAKPAEEEESSSATNPLVSGGDFMQQFFQDVEVVKRQVAAIQQTSVQVQDINQKVALATTTEKEQELSEELKPLLSAANKKANVAKQILQKLREDTERIKTSKDASKQAAEVRIRENLVNTVCFYICYHIYF
jgi:hypothetical protein